MPFSPRLLHSHHRNAMRNKGFETSYWGACIWRPLPGASRGKEGKRPGRGRSDPTASLLLPFFFSFPAQSGSGMGYLRRFDSEVWLGNTA